MSIEKDYRVIGFAGCGQKELIAGCVIYLMKKNNKILLMDYTNNGELRSMISLPKDLENVKNVVLSYRDIDYVKAEKGISIQDFAFEYDVVLADFGINFEYVATAECDQVYYITDMCRHNVLLLKQCSQKGNEYFVLKHFLSGGEAPETYAEELNTDIEKLIVLPYEEKEIRPFLCGTRLDKINLRCFSHDTKQLIKSIVDDKKGRD